MSSSYRCAPKFQWIVFSSTGYECVHFKVRKLRKDYAVFVVLMHRECFSERRVASDEVLDVHPAGPVARLSMMTTSWCCARVSARFEPMKPAPPVTM